MGTGESGAAEESDEGVGLGGGVGAGLGGGVGVGAGGVGEGAGVGGVGDVSGGVSVWLGLAMWVLMVVVISCVRQVGEYIVGKDGERGCLRS